ncbi:unnamed protein product [Citrullus colocynthis]|uniref:Uncharacterized protein n=1 Tax=Citrullus colocynthis TaxID=252529 RepID=A0ABP0YGD4_9ROSI
MYEAQLSSSAYQILGMAEIEILPRLFASRAKVFETPWLGNVVGVHIIHMVEMEAAELRRPFKVPMELPGLVVMCLFPMALLVVLMVLTHKTVFFVSAIMTLAGTLWYFLIKLCKKKKIFKFNDSPQIIQQSYNGISSDRISTQNRPEHQRLRCIDPTTKSVSPHVVFDEASSWWSSENVVLPDSGMLDFRMRAQALEQQEPDIKRATRYSRGSLLKALCLIADLEDRQGSESPINPQYTEASYADTVTLSQSCASLESGRAKLI